MKKYYAEINGTFAMVFCGCGAMTINELLAEALLTLVLPYLGGLIMMTMIYAFGEIYGAHYLQKDLNPTELLH